MFNEHFNLVTTTTVPQTTTKTTTATTTTKPKTTTTKPKTTTTTTKPSTSTTTTKPSTSTTKPQTKTTTSTTKPQTSTTTTKPQTTTTTTKPQTTTTTTTTKPQTTTTTTAAKTTAPQIPITGTNYCYKDQTTNSIICETNVGSIDYTFKSPKTFTMNMSASNVVQNSKITIPIFIGLDYQTKYCSLICSRNQACQGFKSKYDLNNNNYYCDFYKSNILVDKETLGAPPNMSYGSSSWSYI